MKLFHTQGLLLCLLLGGCPSWQHQPAPLPPEVTEAGVRARLFIPTQREADSERILRAAFEPGPESELSVFTLVDAVGYARRHSPRLRSVRATLDGAKGREEVAFAAFLPEVGIASQSGATSRNLGPGIPSVTGFLLTSGFATHSYAQGLLQLQWTVYDFGRRAARYHQATARQRIA